MPVYANRVNDFGTTIFSEINSYAARFDTVNLGQGRPDFDGPQEVIDAMIAALRSGEANQYAPGYGILPLRKAISAHMKRFYQMDVDPEQGIVVTSGAAEGLYSAIMGLVNEGDEVILIEPYFDTYLPAVVWAGAKPVFVTLHAPEWKFDPDELRRAFSSRTRAIVLNTPHNPTGRVFTREELQLVADLCQEFDAIVISDEVYEHLTFDDTPHIPIATLPGMSDRVVTISSGAKTFSMTGWKIGWVMGHPDLITGVWRVHQNVTYAVNHPAQYGIAHALQLDDEYFDSLRTMYIRKRELLRKALVEAGIGVHYQPEGAFYIMGDYSGVYDGDDLPFARWLISEYGVACIPPAAFYSAPNKHLARPYARFSYCKNDDILQVAGQRLAKLRG
jgi:N-succinyldiaminopimelate aminotransferase